jgi:acyl-homoserine lactone acylase PvdQ
MFRNLKAVGRVLYGRNSFDQLDDVLSPLEQAARDAIGSNEWAIGPSKTANGKAMLLINPHTSFFFRSEVHVVSEEGLNAYGAVTWGQFFVYQGFNEKAGWMHTSSNVDNIDEYIETVTKSGVRPVVCINSFHTDTRAEIALVRRIAEQNGALAALSQHWLKGG